jgi:glucokinase
VNIPAWRDFPLVDRVGQLAPVAQGGVGGGGLKVVLLGDGSAMAAGEHWRGSARGYDNALCLVVSTGVGAGLILDGELRTGPSGNAGHLGHISVDFEGEDCPCGSRGCLERYASGTAIAKWAVQHGWRPEGGSVGVAATATAAASASSSASAAATASAAVAGSAVTVAASGSSTTAGFRIATSDNVVERPATAADVAASALRGNEIALAAFDRAGRALAAGIASTAMLVDIRAAVIGGGVAKAGPLLLDPLVHHLARYASLPFTRSLAVLPATLGADAGLIGAAAAIAAATTSLEADRRQP